MSGEAHTTLEYAPRPAWHRRRRWRVIAALIVGFVIGITAYRYGPTAKKRAELILAQQRVAKHPIEPDSLVFEEDPAAARSLLNSPAGGYITAPPRLPNAAVLQVPDAIQRYPRGRLMANTGGSDAPLFAGRLRDDAGNAVIVYVAAGLGMTPGDQTAIQVSYWCDAAAPWSLRKPATPTGGGAMLGSIPDSEDTPFEQLELHRMLRLWSGKPDPDHPQEFTARYAIDGKEGTIRFHLARLGFLRVRVIDGSLTYDNAHAWAEHMRKEHAAELKQNP